MNDENLKGHFKTDVADRVVAARPESGKLIIQILFFIICFFFLLKIN